MPIKVSDFWGMAPKLEERNLGNNQAQVAENCRLFSGALEAWNQNALDTTLDINANSIFKYKDGVWFRWPDSNVSVVRSPVANDPYERVYWTGDGEPRVTGAGLGDTSAPYPTDKYRLGCPAPTVKPIVNTGTHSSPPAGATAEDVITRAYVYTYVTAYGEEGPPSFPSDLIEVNGLQNVTVSSIADPGPYDHAFLKKRIYRTNDGVYSFVAEIDIGTNSFVDEVLTENLAEEIPSTEWALPPADLEGLTELPNGMMAGFRQNQLMFCEPFQPHAWPEKYSLATNSEIVGIAAFGSSVAVLTKGEPYLATGVDPNSMSMDRLEGNYACVSRQSIVETTSGVVYACPVGLAIVFGGSVRLLTEALLKKREWQAYNPSSIRAVFHDGRYMGFYENGSIRKGFILDPAEPQTGLTEIDDYAECIYQDLETDTLFFVPYNSNQILAWNEDISQKTFVWKSKVFQLSNPVNFAWGQIRLQSGSVNFELFVKGQLQYSAVVTNDEPFRLPGGYFADEYEVQLTGSDRVSSFSLAESTAALNQL